MRHNYSVSVIFYCRLGLEFLFMSAWGIQLGETQVSWALLSVFLITSNTEIDSKCEGTQSAMLIEV